MMAAAELDVNATYYAQYPALKSVYGKDQSVLLCLVSYFPPMSYRTVLNTGSSRDSKTSELNFFYKSMKHYVLHHYHQFQEGSYICIGLFQKKTKQGVEDMEFPELLKK